MDSLVLTRVRVDNYQCLVNFELEPQQVALLTGANGAGKTSLLEALQSVRDLLIDRKSVSECFPLRSRTRWDLRNTQTVQLEVAHLDETYTYELVVEHGEQGRAQRTVILSEKLVLGGKTLFRFEGGEVHLHDNSGKEGTKFPFTGARSFFAQLEDRPATKRAMWFRQYMERAWLGQLDPVEMSEDAKSEDRWLAANGANFAAWYRNLAQDNPAACEALLDDLRDILPGLRHIKLAASLGSRVLTCVFGMGPPGIAGATSYELTFDELSDGQRALMALYALVHATPEDTLLFIDEPDNFVTSREVQPWLVRALDLAKERRIQLLVASHHPEVINYAASEGLWFLERSAGGPAHVRRLPVDRESGQTADEAVREAIA